MAQARQKHVYVHINHTNTPCKKCMRGMVSNVFKGVKPFHLVYNRVFRKSSLEYLDVTPLFVVEMLLLGCAVGMVSAALGLGGGIFMVPAFLLFVQGMDAHTAKGTSLFIIIFVSAVNAWRMNRGHVPQYGLAAVIACGSIVGGYLGSWITANMPEDGVVWVFIALLAFVGARTFFITQKKVREENVRKRNVIAVSIGVLASIVGGATGTGGGAVLVPLALIAGIVSNERAVALSNTVMVVTSISGTAASLLAERTTTLPYTYGHVCFAMAPLVFIGAQLINPVATRFEKWLTLERRKVVMGVLLLAMTGSLIWKTMGE